MRPKVLFVINSLAGGGAERVMTTILAASEARSSRYDLAVALLDRDDPAYTLPAWIKTHQLDCRHSLARSVSGLWTLVGRENPTVTLSFLTRSNVATAAAMAPRGKPFIISERVNTSAHLATGQHAWLSKATVRLSYPRAARVIAVSAGVGETLVSDFDVRADRIVAVANPVDVDRIAALAAQEPAIAIGQPYVVAMGRLVPNKNFALTIEAFARSQLSGTLLILGEGPERAALRALGDKLGLGERLQMPGFLDTPYSVIARAEFMALSSNAEGFPNALVEALATGVAVVATDCQSGPAEVLDTAVAGARDGAVGRGGLLVPVEDVEAMTAAFRRMREPELRGRLAASGAERVREFSVARAVERYWAVIDAVLATHA